MLSVRGEAELLAGRPQAAVQTFRDLVAATPQRADAHVALAEAQESAGDISAAKDSVDRALALDPNNRAARVAHARLRLLSLPVPVPDDKANAALNEVTTLASAYPGDAGVAKVRAIAALVVGKPEVAADLLRSVYDATNDGATAVQLASLKGQLGQGQEGLDLLRGHLERFPGDVRARRGLARLLEVSGNPEAAAAQREKAGM
jgi:thioredoxin-like negative regulator of GroEL